MCVHSFFLVEDYDYRVLICWYVQDNNGPREENKSWDKKLWEDNNKKDPFPNAKFRVDTVWMYNFSGSEEEFALMTCLIRQGTVVEKMMIKTSTFPARKRLKIEATGTSN